jgi:hypothetical protein
MKKSAENIKTLLRNSIPVKLQSDNYRFSELSDIARLAASSETMITLVVGDNLTFAEVQTLANISNGYLHVDLSRG